MPRILLTHTPAMHRNDCDGRALAGLRALGSTTRRSRRWPRSPKILKGTAPPGAVNVGEATRIRRPA